MTSTEKYVTNEEDNIIRVCSMSIVLIFMGDIFVSTGGVWRILWFSVCYTAAPAPGEIFDVNPLRGKLHQLLSPNLQDTFIGR